MSRPLIALSSLFLLTALGVAAFAEVAPLKASDLEQSFHSPPDSARAHTWWHWINGNVTAEGITADLEGMKKAGLGGFQVFSINGLVPDGPIQYISDQWRQLQRLPRFG